MLGLILLLKDTRPKQRMKIDMMLGGLSIMLNHPPGKYKGVVSFILYLNYKKKKDILQMRDILGFERLIYGAIHDDNSLLLPHESRIMKLASKYSSTTTNHNYNRNSKNNNNLLLLIPLTYKFYPHLYASSLKQVIVENQNDDSNRSTVSSNGGSSSSSVKGNVPLSMSARLKASVRNSLHIGASNSLDNNNNNMMMKMSIVNPYQQTEGTHAVSGGTTSRNRSTSRAAVMLSNKGNNIGSDLGVGAGVGVGGDINGSSNPNTIPSLGITSVAALTDTFGDIIEEMSGLQERLEGLEKLEQRMRLLIESHNSSISSLQQQIYSSNQVNSDMGSILERLDILDNKIKVIENYNFKDNEDIFNQLIQKIQNLENKLEYYKDLEEKYSQLSQKVTTLGVVCQHINQQIKKT
eukprot:TRINITY_DN240_c6_g1_i1.p1 TRINITY_DN240_c6_g1~~TRINITY_DN240_c6_g1_i1.p1  ORF type:complete len:408 (-),score=65.76 TRINITY_DN240_c6_g1_i1:13-1236(-)